MTGAHTPALERLFAQLVAGESATRLVESWCGAPVRAVRLASPPVVPDADTLRRLDAPAADIVHRLVLLMVDGTALVRADNWFVPARLAPEMVDTLSASDLPFGAVIEPLSPHRRVLSQNYSPDADPLISIEALVVAGNLPVAEVRESFLRTLLSARNNVPEIL